MSDKTEQIKQLMSEKILILDGAMGTMIQSYKLEEKDYRGEQFIAHSCDLKGNNDLLSITQPNIIKAIHSAYFEAGADIIETNTFNSTAISMADYQMENLVYELNKQGAAIARSVADEFEKKDSKPRFVAGVLGPTNRTCSISPDVNNPGYRNISFKELADSYREALKGLIDGKTDIILGETIFDTLNAKAALFAIEDFFDYSVELTQALKELGKENEVKTVEVPVLEPGRIAYTRQQAPVAVPHPAIRCLWFVPPVGEWSACTHAVDQDSPCASASCALPPCR